MKQLRYLEAVELDESAKVKQSNGVSIATYTKVGDFTVQVQELSDEISASIYGADINRMYRISSPHGSLEAFLKQKVNSTSDNISKYSIVYQGNRYRVRVVRNNWVDIDLIGAVQIESI